MEDAVFTLTFTPAELAFVAGLLGGSPQLIEDPFAGWTKERIQAALVRAQDSLVARQYAQVQADGCLAMDTTVAGLVGALAYAESALTITRLLGDESQPSIRRVHFAAGLIVEQEERSGQHELTAVRDRETLISRIQEYLHLGNEQPLEVESFTVSSSGLYEARCVAAVEGAEASAQVLEDAGVPERAASALAQAMADTVCQCALAAPRLEGQQVRPLDRFTLLQSKRGTWLFRPLAGDADRLEALPHDLASGTRHLEGLVDAVVPASP